MKRNSKAGLTLPEIIAALAISSMVGLAIVGVSAALSSAYAHSQDFYETVRAGRTGMLRIQHLFREAKLITATTDTSAVLWAKDTNEDGLIDLTELHLLTYDASRREVLRVRVKLPADLPPDVADAINVGVPLESAVRYATAMTFLSSPYVTSTVLATRPRK